MGFPMNPVERAQRLIGAGRTAEAIALINSACADGDAPALFEKAVWHLIGSTVPRDLPAARSLLSRAARAGHENAAFMEIALTANGSGGAPEFASALELLRQLAGKSSTAASQLALLKKMQLAPDGSPAKLPAAEVLHTSPHLVLYRQLLTGAERAHIAAAAAGLLEPALVADPRTGRMVPHPIRTSKGAVLGPTREDLVLRAINLRIARASKTDIAQGEALAVLHYGPGEQYRLHMDTLPGTTNQRLRTVLLYLNSDFTGGETHFPEIGVTITPRGGDVLVFDNLDPRGSPDPRTRHAGLPVTSGAKWLATRWIRRQPFDVWHGPELR